MKGKCIRRLRTAGGNYLNVVSKMFFDAYNRIEKIFIFAEKC